MLNPSSRVFGAELRYIKLRADALPSASVTSISPGPGPHTLTIGTGLLLEAGQEILIERDGTRDYWILGRVASYSASTGVLVTGAGCLRSSQKTAHTDWVVYDAPIRVATATCVTRADDDVGPVAYTVALQRPLNHEVDALSTDQGFPVFGGLALPGKGTLTLNNGDGNFDWLIDVTFEGQPVRVWEAGTVLDPVSRNFVLVPSTQRKIWFNGLGGGSPDVDTSRGLVTVPLADFADRLRKQLHLRPMLGLGGALRGDGTTSSTTLASISDAYQVTDGATAITFVLLVNPGASDIDGGGPYVLQLGDASTGPFYFRVVGTAYRCRVRTATESSAVIDSGAITADRWQWLVATYDSVTGAFKFYSGFAGESLTLHGTQTLSGVLKSASSLALKIGATGSGGHAFGGGWAHLRIYSAALTADQLAETLRPLDLDDSGDLANLALYVPFDDRFGSVASDEIGGRGATLTAANWTSSATGRPAQAGKWYPITAGRAVSVPLTHLDELPDGPIYTCNWRAIQRWRYVLSAGVALAPTESIHASFAWDINRRRVSATTAVFDRFVPGMSVTFTGDSSSVLDGTYTVEEARPKWIRIVETPTAKTTVAGTFVSDSPGWAVWDAGSDDRPSVIQILGATAEPLVAWVEGDYSSVSGWAESHEDLLRLVCTELGPAIPAASLDFTRLAHGDVAGAFYRGIEPDDDDGDALELVAELAGSVGGVVVAEDSPDELSFVSIDPSENESEPVDTFNWSEIEELDVETTRRLPLSIQVGHSRAQHPLTGDLVEAAWSWLVDRARAPYLIRSSPDDPVAARIPTATASKPFETTLVGGAKAQQEAERKAYIARCRVVRARLVRGLDTLRIGDKIRLYYGRLGFEQGRDVWVVSKSKVPDPLRLDIAALLPPADGA